MKQSPKCTHTLRTKYSILCPQGGSVVNCSKLNFGQCTGLWGGIKLVDWSTETISISNKWQLRNYTFTRSKSSITWTNDNDETERLWRIGFCKQISFGLLLKEAIDVAQCTSLGRSFHILAASKAKITAKVVSTCLVYLFTYLRQDRDATIQTHLSEPGVVEQACVGAGACNDHLWSEESGIIF